MVLSRTTQQRLTACIAILAVLLLFVAPVVSKTLAERHQMRTLNMEAEAASSSSHHSAAVQMQSAETSMMTMDHSAMPDGEFACGYCDLLVHVPLMVWVFIPFIWLMMLISRAPPMATVSAPVIRQPWGFHHPRAPPPALSGTTS
ncbi:DUF2946 domain-containing protein [Pantoea osteomyelitidis]|uniref:DUF2946 domain-containing protein n=1 Tax=Pantoea osteomyelitidis TaxID=3230026 RepID=A0ABW7Q0C0_9GAMM